ncbi:MAG TPA: hypothetical protein DEB70_01750 [Planctomycetaceae bacterium]|nr:hypothetical protein [Planctomycetaceae bacterium]
MIQALFLNTKSFSARYDDAPLLPATHRVLRHSGCSLPIRAVRRRIELTLGWILLHPLIFVLLRSYTHRHV